MSPAVGLRRVVDEAIACLKPLIGMRAACRAVGRSLAGWWLKRQPHC